MTRPSTAAMLRSLKIATRDALHAGGPGCAADIVRTGMVRVKEFALSVAASLRAEHANRFVALDVALDLDFIAGEPFHARALAGPQGYRLVPIDTPAVGGVISHRGLNRVERLADGAILDLRDALENDGRIDVAEARLLAPLLRELHDEIGRKLAKVEDVARSGE